MKSLKQLRKDKKISQEQLGHRLGFGKNTISQYETGIREPNIDTLIKLAEYFDVTVDYLIGRENEVKEKNSFLESIPESRKQLINEILSLSDAESRDIENYIKGYKAAKQSIINFYTEDK